MKKFLSILAVILCVLACPKAWAQSIPCSCDNSCATGQTCISPNGAIDCAFSGPYPGQWYGVCYGTATPNNVSQKLDTKTPDPINIFNGEAFFSATDFSINTFGPKFELSRHYRSFSTFSGLFGYGWRTDFDLNLSQASGQIQVLEADGTEEDFTIMSPGFQNNLGNFNTLVANPDGSFTDTDTHGIARHYVNGRLSSVTDRNKNTLTFVYNPSVVGGTYIQDASGRRIVLNLDSNGHVITAVDPTGKTFQYGYDTNGNLVSITDPTGAVTNYQYDGNHHIIQFTNSNGHNTYYQYNSQNEVTSTYQDNNVNTETLSYSNDGSNTTTVTDSLGNATTYTFNSIGLLLSRKDATGALTQEYWDGMLQLVVITDPLNHTTSYAYDQNGNMSTILDAYGNKITLGYTSNYNLLNSKIDPLGNTFNYTYDANGNLTQIIDPLQNQHHFVYDQYGQVISMTDARGNTTNFTYDAFGDVIQKTDALGNNTNYSYE